MSEHRVLTENEALRLLAHLISTAELHTIEPPHYAGHRMVEGTLPLIDAMIRDGDEESRAWLRDFREEVKNALAARRSDVNAFESFLHQAPAEIIREIKRRQVSDTGKDGRSRDAEQPS